ncbi:MAG TPA: uracil-DNA glycosylase [Ottowia sp.]|uniref:uracil-DNA glycosylase n=1 Tax=Ottowia sp. TaxID=1898956 RepID=UPI002CBE5674|nr:uracil-DNA glycosylase [Ottowia sp.]HMN21973.1 uracil-DNA glycosylase [Ottowia sp.]
METAPRLAHWPPAPDAVAAGWRPLVQDFLASDTGTRLNAFLRQRLAAGAVIYPPRPLLALKLTPPERTRVVILGQDPYHGPSQAYGLAFAIGPGERIPPSLRNIRAEVAREFGREPMQDGLMDHWARQGVLLLNASLTVEAGRAASHARVGWQALTGAVFQRLVTGSRPLVFMLWGAHAQALAPPADARGPHLWCLSNHPSPLSATRPPVPFIGCDHFRRANAFLEGLGQAPIDWLGSAAQASLALAPRSQTMA